LHLFPWTYCLYALREKLLGSKKSAASKLLAPAGECIFDRFWWDFAKQDTNLASKSAPKDAKMHRRPAIRFGSHSATLVPQRNQSCIHRSFVGANCAAFPFTLAEKYAIIKYQRTKGGCHAQIQENNCMGH
ncbi:MAG: hypothetical protein IJF08_05415, partial [Clostridia bacterium]|nr:hypothetical protein [Clostridia bacterium]